MIQGNSVSAYGSTLDEFGRKKEVEFRQCGHCQASWPYIPGSGHRVGMCGYCYCLLCTTCAGLKYKQVDNKCVPFSEGMQENSNKYKYDPNVGIFLRK